MGDIFLLLQTINDLTKLFLGTFYTLKIDKNNNEMILLQICHIGFPSLLNITLESNRIDSIEALWYL